MGSVRVGERYFVVIPVARDGAPDDAEINRALGLPDCALDYEVSPLDHSRVTVVEIGLLTAGGEPAALVSVGAGRWDGSVRVALTPEQVAEIGCGTATDGRRYSVVGHVYIDDDATLVGPGRRADVPRQRVRVVPVAWLSAVYPDRPDPLTAYSAAS